MARAQFRLAVKVTPARSGRNISLQANQSNFSVQSLHCFSLQTSPKGK